MVAQQGERSNLAAPPAALRQPSAKASAASPKLNPDMEMGSMSVEAQNPAATQEQDDIMQLARLGDIQAMEKLFETGGYDATYHDEEGITPLHVCHAPAVFQASFSVRHYAHSVQQC